MAKSEADGSTLLMAANYLAIAPGLYKKMSYDPIRILLGHARRQHSDGLVVNPAVPARASPSWSLAKAKPGSRLCTGARHLHASATELFKQQTGTDLGHVPYRANPLAMNDVIGGQVPVFFDFVTTGAPHVRAPAR